MEIEQLVGFVRLQRAKLAGYECLDEVLTTVQEADTKVKDLQQLQRREQQALDVLVARNTTLEADLAAIRFAHDEQLTRAQDRATEWHEAFDKASHAKEQAAKDMLIELEDRCTVLTTSRDNILAEIQALVATRTAEEYTLTQARNAMAALAHTLGA